MGSPKRESQFVYVLEAGPYFKIGISFNPILRANNIGAFGGHIVTLVKVWHCPIAARSIERLALHRVAARRRHGEWCNGTGRHGIQAVRWAVRQALTVKEIPGDGVYAYVKGGKSAIVK